VHVCYDATAIRRQIHINLELTEEILKEINPKRKDDAIQVLDY